MRWPFFFSTSLIALLVVLSIDWRSSAQDKAAASVGIPPSVAVFFKQSCVKCHANGSQESEFRIDETLLPKFDDAALKARWSEIVDVLNSHAMPPEKEPQPEAKQVAEVVDWITEQIVSAEKRLRETSVVMRRLNRNEYRNTIRDLTGIEVDVTNFPADPLAGGFDNVGAALTFSPMQMELYLDTAQHLMRDAIVVGDQPPMVRWRFEIDSGDSDSNRVRVDGQNPIVNGGRNPVVDGFKRVHHDSWDKKLNVRDFAMKHPGLYRIRMQAAGKVPKREEVVEGVKPYLEKRFDEQMQKNSKGEKWHRAQLDRDLDHFRNDRMYDYGPARLKLVQDLGGQPRTVAEFDVPESLDKPGVHEVLVPFTTQRAGVTIEYAYSIPKVLENFWMQTGDDFPRPELYVDWIEIEGPIHESWPPKSHKMLMPEKITEANEAQLVETTIGRFTRRAFRRQVSREEVAPYVNIYQQARKDQQTIEESLRAALAAVLISPNFLYLVETPKAGSTMVSSFELASRLSYFLWSTTPDAELVKAAENSRLLQREVLLAQFDRLLRDERSEQLVQNFTDQWLGLREVGANPPAPDLYPHYDRHLELSMIEEARALFRIILREYRSALDLIDSDYVVINERLARFYDMDNVRGDDFRVVAVPDDSPRAGILTQTAMLTITSNGTRTSPVKRGTWILKNVLGSDPGLPVANAGDIAPKVPGLDKATVRQRLEIHRQLPQCARCHDKIDPLGLALENFNASGQFRLQEGFGYKGRIEKGDPPIDASSKLPDGTKVNGPGELRKALRAEEDKFLRCLAQKLLTYGLGREMTIADEPVVKQVVAHTKQNQYQLREMLKAIVMSEAFGGH